MNSTTRLNKLSVQKCTFMFNDLTITAIEGESIAAALLANGIKTFGYQNGQPRGPFCGMGSCFECVVLVDNREVRACLHTVSEGLSVKTARRSDNTYLNVL